MLILTAIKMAFAGGESGSPERNVVVRLMRRCLPLAERVRWRTLLREDAARVALQPEAGRLADRGRERGSARHVDGDAAGAGAGDGRDDRISCLQSTRFPAIFAITADPFLVFTSNVFAILGLRSLYFALAGKRCTCSAT